MLSNTSLDVARSCLLAAAWGSLLATPCRAIDPHRAMSQYVRDRWGAEQGFPQGSVYSIAQTTDGYLWMGTESGLVRFDGSQFRSVQDPSKAHLFAGVLGLAAGRDGSLWMRLRNLTLLRYREGQFEDPFVSPETIGSITAMSTTVSGDPLMARSQMGAFTPNVGTLKAVARATGVPRSPVLAVAQTGEGSAWLGTRGAGLFRLTGGQTVAISEGLPDPKIDCLLPDGPRGLWIGTDNGLAYWDGTKIAAIPLPPALRHPQILALAKDRDANLWVGTDAGTILRLNREGFESLEDYENGGRAAITALFEDREGDLWIGSANGIERLRDSPFVTYSTPERLPTDGANPIFVDTQSRAWFSPITGGLRWFQEDRLGQVTADGLASDVVYSIAGEGNDLWLGRQSGGLTHLRLEGEPRLLTTYTRSQGLAQNSVYSVFRDREGDIWAGTLSGGVSKLHGETFTTFTIADGLASNTVASILESADRTMWFATPLGLSSLSQGRWRTFKTADGLPSENVNCLLTDSAGVLWAGTTSGVAFRAGGRFRSPAQIPAPLREQIFGIAEDRYGWLWMATSHHVLRANRQKVLEGKVRDGDLREYGPADGLRGVEGVKRNRSVVTDSLGRIWFSLNHGISVVDPGRLASSSVPAIPQLQTISADGNLLGTGSGVRIPAGRKRIVFGFTAPSLSVPERVRFRYWLEGFDRGWSEPAAEREAAYTNLGPGPYRFHLIASNPDGIWSGAEAIAAFQVAPAFWQTWWFRSAALAAFGLSALFAYRLRLRRLTRVLNLRFEERLSERTRIAQELHDTLLQGFLSASMQVHVASSKLPAESPVKLPLARALDLMRQVTEEGRNAVRGLRSTPNAAADLEDAFARVPQEIFPGEDNGHAAGYRVISEGRRIPLHPLLRDEVYRIGREALVNAFHHAGAKNIRIELNYSPALFRVSVRDDGCGIDPEILKAGRDGHWGLSGMRERADRIGGRLRLWTSAGAGTELELSIPGHIAFRSHTPAAAKRSRAYPQPLGDKK